MANMDKEITKVLNAQDSFFESGKTKDIEFRILQLKMLRNAIKKYEKEIIRSLKIDLRKPTYEIYTTEILMVLSEIDFAIKNLSKWARSKRTKVSIMQFPGAGYIIPEPYGKVLIMAPWNYPIQLVFVPLVGVIAAGNTAVIKPSSETENTSIVIKKIIDSVFSDDYITVFNGSVEVSDILLANKFDFIFFTGSPRVGKIVMSAASKNLTPVCLELGGKSPCIVDETANLKLAAKRIVWGKFMNSGQTCIAPDYIVAHSSIKNKLLHYMTIEIKRVFGNNINSLNARKHLTSIVNLRHFKRLINLIEHSSGSKTERVLINGGYDLPKRLIFPTVIDNCDWDSEIMKDEIFGPILPVVTYENIEDCAKNIRNKPKPLALYMFTNSRIHRDYILKNISFGGGCINDTIMHLSSPHMPFGGVDNSGMGSYHGKASFDIFSHKKSVLNKSTFIDPFVRYAPYTKFKRNLVEFFSK